MITKLSFLLVIISGLIHPLWNMLLKKSDDKIIFYMNIHLVFTFLFSFILFIYPVNKITIAGWIFVLASAFAHFFYQVFLCKTYELGDMSLTYPIIRSAPIFVVVAALIFLREIPTIPALFGIIIVMLGVYIINQKSLVFSDFFRSFGHVNKKAMLAAMLTAFTSACYSVIDKKGVLEIDPVLFFYLFFAISGFLFLIYLLCMKERRRLYFDVLKKHKLGITLAAVLEFASYVLILYAFRISKVSYIIALRQISVIFGALYGILFLKEKYGKIRLAGAAIIFIGIFLITVFGK